MTGGSQSDGSTAQSQGDPVLRFVASDHRLGRRLASLLAGAEGAQIPGGALRAHVQDLLAGDTALSAPVQDLLQRPSFRSLLVDGSPATRLACRDALLQDLASTYQPAITSRLAVVIAGCLDLPSPLPSAAEALSAEGSAAMSALPPAPAIPQSAGTGQTAPEDQSGSPAMPPQGDRSLPAGSGADADPFIPPAVAATSARSSGSPQGGSPAVQLLILICSLLGGALALSLGWILLGGRVPGSGSVPSIPPRPSTPADTDARVFPAWMPAESRQPWAGADRYKFAQAPGGAFPESCAFSASDGRGHRVIDTGRIEYWACRSLGGSPRDGYRVQWADGAITTVRFRNGGTGSITGTEGETSPIRWRNGSHQGAAIVVIEHPDGGQSWVPGLVISPRA